MFGSTALVVDGVRWFPQQTFLLILTSSSVRMFTTSSYMVSFMPFYFEVPGSGLESVCLWNLLSIGCRKRPKLSFSVLARTQIAMPIVEQYNTVLRALLA